MEHIEIFSCEETSRTRHTHNFFEKYLRSTSMPPVVKVVDKSNSSIVLYCSLYVDICKPDTIIVVRVEEIKAFMRFYKSTTIQEYFAYTLPILSNSSNSTTLLRRVETIRYLYTCELADRLIDLCLCIRAFHTDTTRFYHSYTTSSPITLNISSSFFEAFAGRYNSILSSYLTPHTLENMFNLDTMQLNCLASTHTRSMPFESSDESTPLPELNILDEGKYVELSMSSDQTIELSIRMAYCIMSDRDKQILAKIKAHTTNGDESNQFLAEYFTTEYVNKGVSYDDARKHYFQQQQRRLEEIKRDYKLVDGVPTRVPSND